MGTLEALLVLLYAIVPGYVAVRTYELRRAPLRRRSNLEEIARALLASLIAWGLAWWLGARGVLVEVAQTDADLNAGLAQRVYWLTCGVLGLAVALGVVARSVRWGVERRGRVDLADEAWDRLLIKLRKDGCAVLVRVRLRSGGEVFGAFAEQGRADWRGDGGGLLLDLEGPLRPLEDCRPCLAPRAFTCPATRSRR